LTPIMTERSFEIITHSAKQTAEVGRRLGRLLAPGDVVCLHGDLGSGKTCLTQGIGKGLEVAGVISSPTFVLIAEHGPLRDGPYLYHVDLYRIDDYAAAFGLGLEDYMYGDGVTVIEWAERADELLPPERLCVLLTYLDHTKRSIAFEATGARYIEMVAKLRVALGV